jgi:hypothetical protein
MGKPSGKRSANKNSGQKRLGNNNSGTSSSGNSSNNNIASNPDAKLSPNRDENSLNKEANEVADSGSGSGNENLDDEEENLETDSTEEMDQQQPDPNPVDILSLYRDAGKKGAEQEAGLDLGSGNENLGNAEETDVNSALQKVEESDLKMDTGADDADPSSRKRAGSGSPSPHTMTLAAVEELGELSLSEEQTKKRVPNLLGTNKALGLGPGQSNTR